jgi:dipeptidyl aminopeptidase/acylaminoacyl peptidase
LLLWKKIQVSRFTKLSSVIGLCSVVLAACVQADLPTLPVVSPAAINSQASLGRVVFFARDDDLWRTDLNGAVVERLTEGGILNWQSGSSDSLQLAAAYRPAQVSPNGQWIALSKTGLDIILIDVSTHKQIKLSGPGSPFVAWSPDSQSLAYVSESNTDSSDLYRYDIQLGRLDHLVSLAKGEGNTTRYVVWSPDGQFIAFACCFEPVQSDVYTGEFIGKIQQIDVATHQVETAGEIKSSVASLARLCWTADGRVSTGHGVRCTYQSLLPYAQSPDGTQLASLSPLSPDDAGWIGSSLLTISQVATGQILWRRDVRVANAKVVLWSLDSRYLLLDDAQAHSPIWRITADGTSEFEEIVKDGFLLGQVPQW